jgi:hypothetical protein
MILFIIYEQGEKSLAVPESNKVEYPSFDDVEYKFTAGCA